MSPFRIHILGCGSALPTWRHNPTSQVVEVRGKFFMIDCGEGTQLALRHTHVNFNKLSAVFISHLHGDHCLGLVGMISTFGLLGRVAPLHIYAPAALEEILPQQIRFFTHDLSYEVVLHSVDTTQQTVVYADRSVVVESIPLEHRLPCCGYLFREKEGKRHIRREMLDRYAIPYSQVNNLRDGNDWTMSDGTIVPNALLTTAPTPSRSYAYCSDTRYMPSLCECVRAVNVLYHEATYGSDLSAKAEQYWHSTAAQAAQVAHDAQVGQLLLGHYSQRYDDESLLLAEAQQIFPNTLLTNEGMAVEVNYY